MKRDERIRQNMKARSRCSTKVLEETKKTQQLEKRCQRESSASKAFVRLLESSVQKTERLCKQSHRQEALRQQEFPSQRHEATEAGYPARGSAAAGVP